MKKLKVLEDGKQFEVFVKFILTEKSSYSVQDTIVGLAYAGGFTAVRAVHSAMYRNDLLELVDVDTGKRRYLRPNGQYRRVETVDGKVTHHTLLPRSTSDEDYQNALNDMVKAGREEYPSRVLLAPKGNLIEVAGQYLAETFGLPKMTSWSNHYLSILGFDKCQKIDVEVTELAGEWKDLKAVKINPLKEEDVLKEINSAIQQGMLRPKSTTLLGEGQFTEDMTTEEYLRLNAEVLAKKLDSFMKPRTDGVTLPSTLGELKRIPVPAQAAAVSGALKVISDKRGVFFVGDMGSGKTIMSLSTVYAYMRQREQSGAKDGMRCLIISPSNVLPKWVTSEIPKTIKAHRYTTRIISTTEEALAYVREVKSDANIPKGTIEFVLIGTDRMKLASQGFVLGARWDNSQYVWRSPNTGKPLVKHDKRKETKDEDAIASWQDVVSQPSKPPTKNEIDKARKNGELLPNGLPKGYVKKWKEGIRNFEDTYAGEKRNRSLARPSRKDWAETKGGPRWMIAQIFQKHLKNHFHIGVFDEIHQMKASDSGRGAALGKILKSCRKFLFLTGTLTNGASTSIQSILWRAFPGELLRDGINYSTSKEQWAQRYGVVEKITTSKDGDKSVGINSNRTKDQTIVKEKPGISPKMIANYLLDKCVFTELSDLGIPLIELEEIPVIVHLDDDHEDEYHRLHKDLYNTSQSLQREIGSSAWSSFNPTTLNYADQPTLGAEVIYKDSDNKELERITAPAFPKDYVNAKERAILKDVEKQLMKKRRCIIFTNFTGAYQTNERLKMLLEDKGINCEIMNDNVKVNDRFDWLNKQAEKGTEVLIMNMRLVEVGLDLMEFPTLMFYQLNDDINVVRQASRRAWRMGQSKKCEVYYYVAQGTTQMVQFQRLMSRRVAAMIVEGRIERSDDLAKYADTSSSGMVADLSKTLSTVELANAWKSAASKDMDQNLQLVSEKDFQEQIDKAFEELTAKTLRLCGYKPDPNDDVDWEAFERAAEELKAMEEAYKVLLQMEKEQKRQSIQPEKDEVAEHRKIKQETLVDEEYSSTEQLDFFSLLG